VSIATAQEQPQAPLFRMAKGKQKQCSQELHSLNSIWSTMAKSESAANLSLPSLIHAPAIGPLLNLTLLLFWMQERDLLKDQWTAESKHPYHTAPTAPGKTTSRRKDTQGIVSLWARLTPGLAHQRLILSDRILVVITCPIVTFRLGYCNGLKHGPVPTGRSLSIWGRTWQWDYFMPSAEDNISLYHCGRGCTNSLFITRTSSR